MEITKESFLDAKDSKNRDAMLFDMLGGISDKLDDCNKIKDRVSECEKKIAVLRGASVAISSTLIGVGTWFGLR